jgi:glycosyltransferase involved in cell wall biosynthesis
MDQKPLVSIVTPVYNGDAFLRDCIESVLAQTYEHWDYTIVNNCSTDRTLDIAEEYAARDSRIRIQHNKSFVHVVANYNNAFRQISSESKYCKVVAADDWLFPECLEKMVDLAENHPSVAIVGAYGLEGSRIAWNGLSYPSTVVPGKELCRTRLLGGPYIFGTPTSVLYRSDIVRSRHAFYNESNLHSDSEVCMEFLEHYDFGFVHQVLTIQGIQENSLTSDSKRVQTYLPCILHELVNYGQKYLRDEELKYRIRQQLSDYYRYLGEQVYKQRGREFWRYHKKKLAAVGYPLNTPRLAAAAMSYALDAVLNPKSTAEKVARRFRSIWPGAF